MKPVQWLLLTIYVMVLLNSFTGARKTPATASSGTPLNPSAAFASQPVVAASNAESTAATTTRTPNDESSEDAVENSVSLQAEESAESNAEETAVENSGEESSQNSEDDSSEASLSDLKKDVFSSEDDPFEREVDKDVVRSARRFAQERAQWKDEDERIQHTKDLSQTAQKNAKNHPEDREAVRLVFHSTIESLKSENAHAQKELKQSKQLERDLLKSLKAQLQKNLQEETQTNIVTKPHPATHTHRFARNHTESSHESTQGDEEHLTPAQVDRSEAEKIHRERVVAFYDARHIRGGAIGALTRARKMFSAAKLAFSAIKSVENDDPEAFKQYKKKFIRAKYNLLDAKALVKRAKANVVRKATLVAHAAKLRFETRLKAACDDHPCSDQSTVCVANPKAKNLRVCAHACNDFDEEACGPHGRCVGMDHKPACIPACPDSFCDKESINTRCTTIKHRPVCVDPCKYFDGDSVCDKLGGLKCFPTHNATNYFFKCVDLCTDKFCAKEAIDVKCQMLKGVPTCVDPCYGIKCGKTDGCVRTREDRPDLGERSRLLVSSECKPLCPDDGPNPCAQYLHTTGKSRCLASNNKRFCVHPCYNITSCPVGTKCFRKGSSLDQYECRQLCPQVPADGTYPCPPSNPGQEDNTQCVLSEDGHHFQCLNPCKEEDGHNPCPGEFKCTSLHADADVFKTNKFYSCAPACQVDSCPELPNTLCRAPHHEPICTHPCIEGALEDCFSQGSTIGCVPYVRKTLQDKPYRCVDVCQDGGPCRTRKTETQCYRDKKGYAACRNPCGTGDADPCDVEQVCVPNGRMKTGFKCVMSCTQYPCTGKDEVCVSDNTVPTYKRRCVIYPSAK